VTRVARAIAAATVARPGCRKMAASRPSAAARPLLLPPVPQCLPRRHRRCPVAVCPVRRRPPWPECRALGSGRCRGQFRVRLLRCQDLARPRPLRRRQLPPRRPLPRLPVVPSLRRRPRVPRPARVRPLPVPVVAPLVARAAHPSRLVRGRPATRSARRRPARAASVQARRRAAPNPPRPRVRRHRRAIRPPRRVQRPVRRVPAAPRGRPAPASVARDLVRGQATTRSARRRPAWAPLAIASTGPRLLTVPRAPTGPSAPTGRNAPTGSSAATGSVTGVGTVARAQAARLVRQAQAVPVPVRRVPAARVPAAPVPVSAAAPALVRPRTAMVVRVQAAPVPVVRVPAARVRAR
jgi:hypothetical protein